MPEHETSNKPSATKVKTKDGILINYCIYGSGEPLLLIPGLGESGLVWEEHIDAYKDHFMCIVIDNRGSGGSDKPEGVYTTDLMADDALCVVDSLGIERFHVSGIGMGGAIAQKMTVNYGRRIKSCILTASWSRCHEDTKNALEALKDARNSMSHEEFLSMYCTKLYSTQYLEENPKFIGEFVVRRLSDQQSLPQHAFEAQVAACINHDTLSHMHRIFVPFLHTVGNNDSIVPYVCSAEMHQRIITSRLESFNGAHAFHSEESDKYNNLTLEFLLKYK